MIAWITGGGTGIGRALAEALVRQGYSVAISGRRGDLLSHTAMEIASSSGAGQIAAFPADVADADSVEQAAAEIGRRWGAVHLLINNAGANTTRPFDQTPLNEYEESFRINCLGAIACTKAVLPGMRERRAGGIVNISSIYGKWGGFSSASYSVGKFAVTGFTDVLRQELAGTGIHVMGVFPGFIRTAMTLPFVTPGSFKDHFGKSPESAARVILKALKRKKAELYYPWYVSWLLRAHRMMPGWSDRIAPRIKRRR